MRRIVTAPIHLKSENKFRGFTGGFVAASSSKRTRRDVGLVLTQIPKPPLRLADGSANTFRVTLVRISVGILDDDNLRGACKAARDEVAAWIGIDDGHHLIRFLYDQKGCRRGRFGLQITVDDDTPGEPYARELAGVPAATFEARKRGAPKHQRSQPVRPKQVELTFRDAYAVLPWEQDGGEPVLTKLAIRGVDPPRALRLRVPARMLSAAASVRYQPGGEVVLERGLARVGSEELWVYTVPESTTEQAEQPTEEA
jgi:hypothetical protein